jgi:hypothetical protein
VSAFLVTRQNMKNINITLSQNTKQQTHTLRPHFQSKRIAMTPSSYIFCRAGWRPESPSTRALPLVTCFPPFYLLRNSPNERRRTVSRGTNWRQHHEVRCATCATRATTHPVLLQEAACASTGKCQWAAFVVCEAAAQVVG